MPSRPRGSERSSLAIAGFLLCGLALTIAVPFHVPVQPTVSVSYIFGFNNRLALLLFLAFIAAFGGWLRSRPPQVVLAVPAGLSRARVSLLFGLPAALLLLIWWLTRDLGGVNESTYFLDRLQQLAHGRRAYRDFEFLYGPLILYLPLWLARLTHLSLTDAYYVVWIAQWLLGLWFLWRVVEHVCSESPRKNQILLLLALTWIWSMLPVGPNYTPLRFWAVPYAVVVIYRRLSRNASMLPAIVLALLWACGLLLYSPEQSFSLSGGTLLLLVLFFRWRRRRDFWPALLLQAAGTAATFAYAAHAGYLKTAHAMASGGYNFPLLPAPHLVPLLGLLAIAGWVFVDGLRHPREAGVAHYLVATTIVALPAAFGRCDSGHLIVNTVGASVVAWAVAARDRTLWRWATVSYVLIVLLLPLPITLYSARQIATIALKRRYPPERLASMPATGLQGRFAALLRRHAAPPAVRTWSDVLPDLPARGSEVVMVPFGLPRVTPQDRGPEIVTSGYFHGLQDVMLPSQVDEKIAELRAHPAQWLLVPARFQCDNHVPSRRELVLELSAMYFPRAKHQVHLYEPYCEYIRLTYEPVETTLPSAEYMLLKPRATF